MNFRIGQKVVCVREPTAEKRALYAICNFAKVGDICTIRGFVEGDRARYVLIEETINPPMRWAGGYTEFGYPLDAFRPLIERKTDISIFTEMLNTQTVPLKQREKA